MCFATETKKMNSFIIQGESRERKSQKNKSLRFAKPEAWICSKLDADSEYASSFGLKCCTWGEIDRYRAGLCIIFARYFSISG
jgi:hypothetical protein